jgi:hypothetical protein
MLLLSGVPRPGALAHGAAYPAAAEPLLCYQRLQRPVPATLRVCHQVPGTGYSVL